MSGQMRHNLCLSDFFQLKSNYEYQMEGITSGVIVHGIAPSEK